MNNLQVQEKIKDLESKLERLEKINDFYSAEVEKYKLEMETLKKVVSASFSPGIENEKAIDYVESEVGDFGVEKKSEILHEHEPESQQSFGDAEGKFEKQSDIKSNLEKFIGENLLNKIGIVITVIGVAIGVQYSIEHNLVSPLVRIISGYIFGLALLFVGLKLKDKYLNYSAVLVSGSAAIMYFLTFAAYSFYNLFPISIAFFVMVLFTVLTVFAALKYNRQIIGLLGLVGAYATPFLLSSNSGKVWFLFTYMAIINSGILYIAIRKYWKILYYSAFMLSWLVFSGWFGARFSVENDFLVALIFSFVFFLIFCATFLINKLLKGEKFEIFDIAYFLSNSFHFFGFGYAAMEQHETFDDYQGLFTALNAVFHAVLAFVIYQRRDSDKNLYFLISGLAISFLAISIPVQLDGNWVTLLWISMVSVLIWVGRTRKINFYEILGYVLLAFSVISLMKDWGNSYTSFDLVVFQPFLNNYFFTTIYFAANIGFVTYLIYRHSLVVSTRKFGDLNLILSNLMPIFLAFLVYLMFFLEISHFWAQYYENSTITTYGSDGEIQDVSYNYLLTSMKIIWLINYSVVFSVLLLILGFKRLKNSLFTSLSFAMIGLLILVFLSLGLTHINILVDSFLKPDIDFKFVVGSISIILRYVSLALFTLLVVISYLIFNKLALDKKFLNIADIVVNVILIIGLSSELSTIFKYFDIQTTTNYELTALWGIYSLSLISFGIWRKSKHLRLLAIGLFGVTLLKLFIFDIASLSTLPKTLIFVSLGILLLIASFLYQRFKVLIFGDDDKTE